MLTVSDEAKSYAELVAKRLAGAGIRVEREFGTGTIGGKIRDAQLQKIPYMLVVGEREAAESKVAVRLRSGKDLGAMPLETFISRIRTEAESRVDVAE